MSTSRPLALSNWPSWPHKHTSSVSMIAYTMYPQLRCNSQSVFCTVLVLVFKSMQCVDKRINYSTDLPAIAHGKCMSHRRKFFSSLVVRSQEFRDKGNELEHNVSCPVNLPKLSLVVKVAASLCGPYAMTCKSVELYLILVQHAIYLSLYPTVYICHLWCMALCYY